ncbi:MAG: Gx transporter family protein [Oscillospiraceae bacterium]|nr:Gx transporter family protein [Oscillospiraceae bacterium]
MKIRKLTELAMLTALALIIFVIELHFPDIAIPGVKLGLANIITVYAVFVYKPSETAMLVACRVILGAIFTGNMSALLYSASGALLCLLGMLYLKRFLNLNYIWLCSILGGILHNTGQIASAMLVMQTTAVISYLPVLVLSGSIAGLFTGLCAQAVLKRFRKKEHL